MGDQAYIEEVGEMWKYDRGFHRLADFLGVDREKRNDARMAKKMFYLIERASIKAKSKDIIKIMNQIDKMRKDTGESYQGELLINRLYQDQRLSHDTQASTDWEAVKMLQKDEETQPKPKKAVKTESNLKAIQSQIEAEKKRSQELQALINQSQPNVNAAQEARKTYQSITEGAYAAA